MSESEVMRALEGSEPALVFVYGSQWDNMCREWDAMYAEYVGDVKMMKIDINNAPNLHMKYGVHQFPTILASGGGRRVGFVTKARLRNILFELATLDIDI